MTLWVVRHAQPLIEPGICYGALDMPADAQATQVVAESLAAVLPRGAMVHTSVLQRCELLAKHLCGIRPDLLLKHEPRLVEMDFGTYEGVAWTDIPKEAMDAWTDDFWTHRFGGEESLSEFMARVAQVWDACHGAPALNADHVWITHAGVARASSLLAQGQRHIQTAAQWPRSALAFGQWVRVGKPVD